MLILVATPIGNLSDCSSRALEALQASHAILCEDTRRSQKLLSHFGIEKKLIPYHKFTEKKLLRSLLEDLLAGKTYALISDAGTPCINDPGQILVKACYEAGIQVDAIPGPCSIIQALILSGLPTDRFQFLGFLPKNPKETLKQILSYPGTTVVFESPERILKTLKLLPEELEIAVLREMTKTFQERLYLPVKKLFTHFQNKQPRGEFVLVFPPGSLDNDMPLEELVVTLQELLGYSLKEAIHSAAKLKQIPKRDIYKKFHL